MKSHTVGQDRPKCKETSKMAGATLALYTQYGPITNVGIFPGLRVLYFCPDFQG